METFALGPLGEDIEIDVQQRSHEWAVVGEDHHLLMYGPNFSLFSRYAGASGVPSCSRIRSFSRSTTIRWPCSSSNPWSLAAASRRGASAPWPPFFEIALEHNWVPD